MPQLTFRKVIMDADHACEAAGVVDVDGDGHLDILCGTHWYQGPHWTKYFIRDILMQHEYHDDFANLPVDVDGDGAPDFLTGGWFNQSLLWCQNPRQLGVEWTTHLIDSPGNVETARLWDVDGDGYPDLVPNLPGNPLVWYRLDRDSRGMPLGRFVKHVISERPSGHGMGFGDINGDGREDLILPNGWYEAPEDRRYGTWIFHPEFDLGGASIPILVWDVNGDGVNDLLYGMAHDYGLFWLEQRRRADGSREWVRHAVDLSYSQVHDLHLADLDGDGNLELVTGKRWRAHNDGDPGGKDPCCVYWYQIDRATQTFTRHNLDVGNRVGVGLHSQVCDINGDGRPDIICCGKGGLYLFVNEGVI